MKKVVITIVLTFGMIIVGYFIFFSAVTPSIKGTVIDAETKEPVENAWVIVTVINSTSTIAGSTGNTDPLTPKHMRTGKDGKFKVPMRFFVAGIPPLCFGREVSNLKAVIRVPDGRRADVDLSKYLKKWSVTINIPVKNEERTYEEINSELSTLFSYCTTGMYFPIYPYGSELCDKWELEYTIAENERFLKIFGNHINSIREETYYVGSMHALSGLYRQAGNYKKAFEYLTAARDFDKKRGVTLSLAEYEQEINELRDRLKENSK